MDKRTRMIIEWLERAEFFHIHDPTLDGDGHVHYVTRMENDPENGIVFEWDGDIEPGEDELDEQLRSGAFEIIIPFQKLAAASVFGNIMEVRDEDGDLITVTAFREYPVAFGDTKETL